MHTSTDSAGFRFDNSYVRLPERFYARLDPTPVSQPSLLHLNDALVQQLGLDQNFLRSDHGIAVLAGNQVPPGAAPLAMAYAGHQFGGWSPQLGDGRALLLGEVLDRTGQRWDIQLKGSGPTPFSRMGDGRAWLGPVLREYVVSEAMATLGVPTTRALAVVATGDNVYRERPMPGAVLTRVARSHVRVGTFQYFAARRDVEALRLLADHVILRQYRSLTESPLPERYLQFLEAVVDGQARLVAKWQSLGFIHGVMNTDNASVTGDTIDYGPCAFMDHYDAATVYSSIDHNGRYAYQNQPAIAQWNMAQLAQCLLPILNEDSVRAIADAQQIIDLFPSRFDEYHAKSMRAKLGLISAEPDDLQLLAEWLSLLQTQSVDFTQAFRQLNSAAVEPTDTARKQLLELFVETEPVAQWINRWHERLRRERSSDEERHSTMRLANPVYIPRNHLVESMITAAVDNDWQPFEKLVEVLAAPFDQRSEWSRYASPPTPEERIRATFCGT